MINKTKISNRAGKKTNPELKNLIVLLKKQKKPFWIRVAQLLARPRRIQAEVNFAKLSKLTTSNETVLIPGKLLATGTLEHPLTIAAFKLSSSASNTKNAKLTSIEQLLKLNPQGKNIKIII